VQRAHRRSRRYRYSAAQRVRRRRTAAVVLAAAALLAFALGVIAAAGSSDPAYRARLVPGSVDFVAVGRDLAELDMRHYTRRGHLGRTAVAAAIRRRLPATVVRRRARSRIVYRLDKAAAVRRVFALPWSGGTVRVPARRVSASVRAPVIAQKLRDNCETAALEIWLATRGVPSSQLKLQSQLARSGPLDPRGSGAGRVWGDPEHGFVGRADGGGPAGGFGVYAGPVAALARARGTTATALRGGSLGTILRRLGSGQAVIAWVGLSDGPYAQWRSPSGRHVKVNFGEHVVVLVGFDRSGRLLVDNPLRGTLERWSAPQFTTMWQRLGRRTAPTSRRRVT
jgi:uncharacterized protein YvpB